MATPVVHEICNSPHLSRQLLDTLCQSGKILQSLPYNQLASNEDLLSTAVTKKQNLLNL